MTLLQYGTHPSFLPSHSYPHIHNPTNTLSHPSKQTTLHNSSPQALNPPPSALLYCKPSTHRPPPSNFSLNPPCTLSPQSSTLSPRPSTHRPSPSNSTLNPPHTALHPSNSALHPPIPPSTPNPRTPALNPHLFLTIRTSSKIQVVVFALAI